MIRVDSTRQQLTETLRQLESVGWHIESVERVRGNRYWVWVECGSA